MGPPRSGSGRGPPSPEVVVEETPPKKWQWKRTPPRSGGGREPLPGSGSGRGPPQGNDQTRSAEKYCWASRCYALEKGFLVLSAFEVYDLVVLADPGYLKFLGLPDFCSW